MLTKSRNIPSVIVSWILSIIILSIISAIVMFVIVKAIILRMSDIPESVRNGYDNSLLSIFGIFLLFIAVSHLLYFLIVSLAKNLLMHRLAKIILGIICGLVPVFILQSATFGFSFSDVAFDTEISILGVAGACIPTCYRWISRMIAGQLQ